jgi:hypothetical protein
MRWKSLAYRSHLRPWACRREASTAKSDRLLRFLKGITGKDYMISRKKIVLDEIPFRLHELVSRVLRA